MGDMLSRWARVPPWFSTLGTAASLLGLVGVVLWFAFGLQGMDAAQQAQIDLLTREVDALYLRSERHGLELARMQGQIEALQRDIDRVTEVLRRVFLSPPEPRQLP